MLGVDLQPYDTLLKYIGSLHNYLRHTTLIFNPNNLDDVCVQATHLEEREKNTPEEGSKNPFKGKEKEKGFKGKKNASIKRKERKQSLNIVAERVAMKLTVGSFILK